MTNMMDLSFPGQRTTTATSCIPHDSVKMPGPRAGKLKMAFFVVILDSKYSKMTPKICEAEITLTPLIDKICKPCLLMVILFCPLKLNMHLSSCHFVIIIIITVLVCNITTAFPLVTLCYFAGALII